MLYSIYCMWHMGYGQARRLRARKRPARICDAFVGRWLCLKSLCLVGSHWARRDRAGIEGDNEREREAVGFIKSARQAGNPLHSMRRPFHSRIAVTFFFPVKSEKRQVGKAVWRTKRYPVLKLMYRFNTMYLFPHRMLNNCGTIAIITNGLPNIPLL